jgi:predicted thioesterase
MVRLMEIAAARCLEPLLGEGEQSVGITIEVEHTAATPLGATVRAQARFVEQNGNAGPH